MRTGNYEELESALVRWFTQVRDRVIIVTGPILLQKDSFFAEQLGIDDFKQSTGWLDRFKERNNITFKTVSGESKSVDQNEVDKWSVTLKSVLSQYEPRDIYNADERGLFLKLTPDKTLEFKNVKCVGGKRSKERITVLVCANMTGEDKVALFVIGKSKNPRCFKNVKTLPCKYDFNTKAFMAGDIFSDWLLELDKQFQIQKRKIAMVVDNCPAHPNVVKGLRNIELVFLAPNTTSDTTDGPGCNQESES
ncbi:tigger transposable element-derived protein 4-like [Mercenaria mercenaria]|uniref:tigger transposable element-derived protein 4-like n=1 Tax=Mercenaria mercenaria TaxID=6596 RepID=UPI001E1E1ABF|nr:tigger transposable element-derived protein 4-like [Mercenaria mercenaria]